MPRKTMTSIRLSRALIATAAFALASVLAPSAQAVPVTYDLVTGSLDTVQMLNLAGGPAPCPVGGVVDCLVSPVVIDGASVTIDKDTGEILNLTITLSGTGEVNLAGLNGWDSATFTGTTFQSVGTQTIVPQGSNQFALLPYAGNVTVGALALFAVGNPGPAPNFVFPYGAATAPNGSILLTGDELALTLIGVDIGFFRDPITGQQVLVKADFSLVAAQTPIPEPHAAMLFFSGFLVAGFAVRQARTA